MNGVQRVGARAMSLPRGGRKTSASGYTLRFESALQGIIPPCVVEHQPEAKALEEALQQATEPNQPNHKTLAQGCGLLPARDWFSNAG